jgi:hypothetical protein
VFKRNFNSIAKILTLSTLIVALPQLSGCRLGNRSERIIGNPGNEETVSEVGLYQTVADAVEYCAGFSNGTTACRGASTSTIPNPYAKVMADVTAFYLPDKNQSDGWLLSAYDIGKSNISALPIEYDRSTNKFKKQLVDSAILWDFNSNGRKDVGECQFSLTRDLKGALVPGSKVVVGQYPTIGRLELTGQDIQAYDSDCGPTLQFFYDCYTDASACRADEGPDKDAVNNQIQAVLRSNFSKYIESGAMLPQDIPNLTGVGFSVDYR